MKPSLHCIDRSPAILAALEYLGMSCPATPTVTMPLRKTQAKRQRRTASQIIALIMQAMP